jgi:hypothetical protein
MLMVSGALCFFGGVATAGLGSVQAGRWNSPIMTRTSSVRGMHPAIRVYLVGFAMFVGTIASFDTGVKVLGFVFLALTIVFVGITTVMLLTFFRRTKSGLRATQAQQRADLEEELRNPPREAQ